MRKLLTGIFLISFIVFGSIKVQAISFDDAIREKKPCAILLYANWADNINAIMPAYNAIEQQYGDKYNFLKINIANEEAKSFNKTNYIYPNLPYVLLFKERGRMSRCITQDCLMNDTCIKEKLDLFAN